MENESEKRTISYLRRQGGGTVYSDYANVHYSYQGIRIYFASFAPFEDKDKREVAEEVAAIGMSAEQAKSLHALLGRQLKTYEEKFGTIRDIPPGEVAEEKDSE